MWTSNSISFLPGRQELLAEWCCHVKLGLWGGPLGRCVAGEEEGDPQIMHLVFLLSLVCLVLYVNGTSGT
jgi:hypothetical protein